MKKIIFIFISALFISCGSTNSVSNDGVVKMNKKTLKGTWKITNIRFVGEKGLYKANLFDMADSSCFNDSEWVFIPNNGSGKYSIISTSHCDAVTNRIHWSFYKPEDGTYKFQFKYVDKKNKPLSEKGYRANIDLLTATSMVLRVVTSHNNKEFNVILSYIKTSDDINL